MELSAIFFFNDTATTEIYTLSLHDALPISVQKLIHLFATQRYHDSDRHALSQRSEEHTSELQSQSNLVCRLLLEKKNKTGNDGDFDDSSVLSAVYRHYCHELHLKLWNSLAI